MTDIITDDDIDWENSGNWFGEACDCVEILRAELARVKAKSEKYRQALEILASPNSWLMWRQGDTITSIEWRLLENPRQLAENALED